MKTIIIKSVIAVIISIASFLAGLNCKTYEPVRIKGEIPICNDMYSIIKAYVKFGIKSDSLVTRFADKCIVAREKLENKNTEEICKKWIYKKSVFDKNKYPEYGYYLECIK